MEVSTTVRIKTLRSYIRCEECEHEKKKMTFIRLSERPRDYCKYCQKATFWKPIYHTITYEEVE